jgi:hypothetical protein
LTAQEQQQDALLTLTTITPFRQFARLYAAATTFPRGLDRIAEAQEQAVLRQGQSEVEIVRAIAALQASVQAQTAIIQAAAHRPERSCMIDSACGSCSTRLPSSTAA